MILANPSLAATPVDAMIILLDRAQVFLWVAAGAALIGGLLLALSENNHRVEMRTSVDVVADNASEAELTDASKLAALVELVRALAHPLHTVFQTSRAVVAVGVAGALVIAAALVPVLGTALVANFCKPHFPPAAPVPAVASPATSPSGDGADGGGDDAMGAVTATTPSPAQENPSPQPQPSPAFAPGCEVER